jgi:hypothetical protein
MEGVYRSFLAGSAELEGPMPGGNERFCRSPQVDDPRPRRQPRPGPRDRAGAMDPAADVLWQGDVLDGGFVFQYNRFRRGAWVLCLASIWFPVGHQPVPASQ